MENATAAKEIQTDSRGGGHGPEVMASIRETVKRLGPSVSEAEQVIAEQNLLRYFEIAIDIAAGDEPQRAALTAPDADLTVKERSNDHLKT